MRHVEEVMGTAVVIDVADPLPHHELAALIDGTCAWLHEVDARFSTYKDDSEVNRLDRGELTADRCSPDLRTVLDACAALRRETDGYFDDRAAGRFDPSGYVKGWSVEVASARLAEAGSRNHCVNAGGDIRSRGCPEPGRPWRYGIRHPWEPDRLAWVLTGTDLAVATSGTYERGLHVFDPHSGEPVRALRSVTVTGPDLALADAYATAAMAMGTGGLLWLAHLAERSRYQSAVITRDRYTYLSDDLPLSEAVPERPPARASGSTRWAGRPPWAAGSATGVR
ncbi:FAD:protein FMN transferase [Spirillospora sp. NPDC047279]|uniref:FAD:protein FMN transferase n=1 Tax=Spirillospora sp. NPDC047279 TaxID=3155478 RepID=UPI0033E6E7AD